MSATTARLTLIDCLRGVASLYVALFHIFSAVVAGSQSHWLPTAVTSFFDYGDAGVQMFFVLSGFVLTYGLLGREVTARFCGRFIARRSVRLDPSYWLMIAVSLVAYRLSGNVDIPLADIPFNMFYMDNLFSKRSVIPVGWTLCIEFQFYLVLIGLFWMVTRLASAQRPAALSLLVLLLSGAAAWWKSSLQGSLPPGVFLEHFDLFAVGVAVSVWLRQSTASTLVMMVATLLVAAVGAMGATGTANIWLGLATAMVIVTAGKTGQLSFRLGGKAMHQIGVMSYSLYLVHPFVIGKFVRAVYRFVPATATSPMLQTALFVAALALALAASWLFWRLIEQPTQRWAQRIALKS